MIPLPPTPPKKQKIPCPACGGAPCYKHCNHCGKSIHFRKDENEKWKCYESGTEVIHRCMKPHSKDRRYRRVNNDEGPQHFPTVDEVDDRTKEIELRRWKATVGYQPLNRYEKEHLEFSRKYYDDYYRIKVTGLVKNENRL